MSRSPIPFILGTCLMLSTSLGALGAGPASAPAANVTPADQITFEQKNASAQMQELQERMFRLAELTRQTEPGDSARLLMAVRKAREQLIYEQMQEVMDLIAQKDTSRASEDEKEVLAKLEELKQLLLSTDLDLQLQLERLRKLQSAIAKLDAAIKEQTRLTEQTAAATNPARLDGPRQQQEQNRKTTEALNQDVRELGDPFNKASPALGDAGLSMAAAEASFTAGAADKANGHQSSALQSLKQARDQLEQERQQLLADIESQVKRQVLENLAYMLERQTAVREATTALAPGLEAGKREVALRVRRLSTAEEHIAEIGEQTATLIEETEFSFALPPALHSVQRRCIYVATDLDVPRADATVITAEREIESDLAELIETFKASTNPSDGTSRCKGCKSDKNKLLAELKVMRLLQVRVNEETRDVDGLRQGAEANLFPEVRQKIGSVRDHQDQVRRVMQALDQAVVPHAPQNAPQDAPPDAPENPAQ